MTVGKDVSSLFTDVVNCMQTENLELKKLVYLYLINYAKSQPDLAILAVNTFVKVKAGMTFMLFNWVPSSCTLCVSVLLLFFAITSLLDYIYLFPLLILCFQLKLYLILRHLIHQKSFNLVQGSFLQRRCLSENGSHRLLYSWFGILPILSLIEVILMLHDAIISHSLYKMLHRIHKIQIL